MLIFLTGINVRAGDSPDTAEAEINHLLQFVGGSGCVFNRNGTRHEATEAESHLRMKYRKGRRYVSDAEQFIDRLATKSSWTGQAYTVECPGRDPQPSGEWLHTQLGQHRATQQED